MSHDVNRLKPYVYKKWIETPSAQKLCALEAFWIREYLALVQGNQVLFAGIDLTPKFINKILRAHAFRMGLPWQKDLISCQAYMQDNQWPLADASVDIVVLQHGLDLSQNPHQMLREASRVLIPNGYLFVIGFNPNSVWGLIKKLNIFSSKLPWVSKPIAVNRLVDWLTMVDMRVETLDMQAHLWPFSAFNDDLTQRVNRVMAKQNWLPASTYCCMARKTVSGVTPIREHRLWGKSNSFVTPAMAKQQNREHIQQ